METELQEIQILGFKKLSKGTKYLGALFESLLKSPRQRQVQTKMFLSRLISNLRVCRVSLLQIKSR